MSKPQPSTSAQFFKINASVTVDEATAQTGNITVTVGGQTSANVSTLVVGSYGSFGLTDAASGTAPTITAGVEGSNIGELEIKEGIPGSLLNGRTITLTLPTNVAWTEYSDPGHQPLHQHRKRRQRFQRPGR